MSDWVLVKKVKCAICGEDVLLHILTADNECICQECALLEVNIMVEVRYKSKRVSR